MAKQKMWVKNKETGEITFEHGDMKGKITPNTDDNGKKDFHIAFNRFEMEGMGKHAKTEEKAKKEIIKAVKRILKDNLSRSERAVKNVKLDMASAKSLVKKNKKELKKFKHSVK